MKMGFLTSENLYTRPDFSNCSGNRVTISEELRENADAAVLEPHFKYQ